MSSHQQEQDDSSPQQLDDDAKSVNSMDSFHTTYSTRQQILRSKEEMDLYFDEKMQVMQKEFVVKAEKAAADGFKRGREEAEAALQKNWVAPTDPKLLTKAKALEYIDFKLLRPSTIKKEKTTVSIGQLGGGEDLNLVFNGTSPKEAEKEIKWFEFNCRILDAIDVYVVQAGHVQVLGEMLKHWRLMLRFGIDHIYTHESIIAYDAHVRSRDGGQGPKLNWGFDFATSKCFLKEFVAKERKQAFPSTSSSNSSSKSSSGKKATGRAQMCHLWAIGKCSYSPCKYLHSCSPCGVSGATPHALASCPLKDIIEKQMAASSTKKKGGKKPKAT